MVAKVPQVQKVSKVKVKERGSKAQRVSAAFSNALLNRIVDTATRKAIGVQNAQLASLPTTKAVDPRRVLTYPRPPQPCRSTSTKFQRFHSSNHEHPEDPDVCVFGLVEQRVKFFEEKFKTKLREPNSKSLSGRAVKPVFLR